MRGDNLPLVAESPPDLALAADPLHSWGGSGEFQGYNRAIGSERYDFEVGYIPREIHSRAIPAELLDLLRSIQALTHSEPQRVRRVPKESHQFLDVVGDLLKNPSHLGRLILIANLWNPKTGRYDRGLPEHFQNRPEVEKASSNWHKTFFIEWFALPLTEKERDVALYWRSIGGERDQIHIVRQQAEAALPPLVRSEERIFFMKDLAFILAML